VSLLID
jgi:hypothetical protein